MAITESGQNRVLLHLACLVIILAGLKAASAIVVPLLFAIFIAIIAYTPIQWLTEHKVPLWLSVILVLLSVVAVIVGIGGLVMQSAFELQAQQAFYEQRLGQLMADLLGWLE
ncbi:MAG: AI-2E family transporter, partial [Gammaproteobacteria bacterium]|nr:AI-2E family transporter [Gammaproteobacteria bacterium]